VKSPQVPSITEGSEHRKWLL